MSASESTLSSSQGFRPDTQMNLFGWLIALPLVVLLLPLVPIVLVYWALSKASGNA